MNRQPTHKPTPLNIIQVRWLFGTLLINAARALLDSIHHYVSAQFHCDHDSPCLIWQRGNDGRYGHLYFLGARFKVHRFVYIASGGRLRFHEVVDHDPCNQTLCCQRAHLRAVSQSKNVKRCFDVGRGRSPFIRSLS